MTGISSDLLATLINYKPCFPFLRKTRLCLNELLNYTTRPFQPITRAAQNQLVFMSNLQTILNDLLINQPPIQPLTLSQLTSLNSLIHAALFQEAGRLRDELYWQVLKHLHSNPNRDQVEQAWKLLSCLTASFPPSQLLKSLLTAELTRVGQRFDGSFKDDYCATCEANLWMFSITGPRGYVTGPMDISLWFDEVRRLKKLFGVSLTEIAEWDSDESNYSMESGSDESSHKSSYSRSNSSHHLNPSNYPKIPRIVSQLIEMIVRLDGPHHEGIFRISGDLQQVLHLKTLLSVPSVSITYTDDHREALVQVNEYTVRVHDPAVPCSLLKLWLRVLKEPLLADPLYSQLLEASNDPASLKALLSKKLPPQNYDLLYFLLRFLTDLAHKHYGDTKMDLNNFGMIFAPCFMRCPIGSTQQVIEQSKLERELMTQLFAIVDEK